MYKILTDNQVKELMRDKYEFLVVSHVGDGEYSCNVFGNIYTSFWQALKFARLREKNSEINMYSDPNKTNILICWGNDPEYSSYIGMPAISRLTLEQINQRFDFGGD